jgi:hypothetical protein
MISASPCGMTRKSLSPRSIMSLLVAHFKQPTPAQEAEHRRLVSKCPKAIRRVMECFDPWTLYRLKSTGHRCILYSAQEDDGGNVTLTMEISGEFNLIEFNRCVFGIEPEELEECAVTG